MFKKTTITAAAVMVMAAATAQVQPPMYLCYDRPAEYFEESLPIGNGKIGALVYGGVEDNIIYLNDITLWTGKPVDRQLDSNAHEWIPKIREALFAEDYQLADSLQLHVQGPNSQFFQPLATLHIEDLGEGGPTSYQRRLSLDSALVSDSYVRGGSRISREYFASNPDRLIAIRMRGDLHLRLMLTGQTPHHAKATATAQQGTLRSGQLTMTGHAMGSTEESIHFCTILRVLTDGQVAASDSTLTVDGAHELTLYVVNETSFNGFDKHPVREGAPYIEKATNAIWHTQNLTYDEMRSRHIADYQSYFNRVSLRLGTPSACPEGSTDRLLKAYTDSATLSANDARYLETLYFQYGRYLLIASSRTPGVPANLQGLWTPHLWSPWRGNYTVNINLEENYWPAFVANLAEMAEPLDDFVRALAENGRFTARNYYGIENGWCSSHNSDIWAMTNPVGEKREKPEWANWNMGGAWLVNTLWERYLFTQDTRFLFSTALPLMQGAADFCMDWLIENPNNPKELITAPSTSPENEYKTDKGYHGMTCYGSTADMAIIRELLENTRQATTCAIDIMGGIIKAEMADSSQVNMLRQAVAELIAYRMKLVFCMTKLHPYTVGKNGDLNEWYHDWEDWDPQHRHQSHLIGLYPGQHYLLLQHLPDDAVLAVPNQLSKEDFMKAAEQTLIQKGDETTGWSTGWRINLWARLGKAKEAYRVFQKLLTFIPPDKSRVPNYQRGGGTYPNLMDAHPPFQIDGNFGGTAGVCEMLLQSHCDDPLGEHTVIELLPALPPQWNDGSVSGLCARGGYEVDFEWKDGKVRQCSVKARKNGTITLRYNGQQKTVKLEAGKTQPIKTW